VTEWLNSAYDMMREHPLTDAVLPHLLTVVGVLLAFLALARLLSERRQPGNTFAWLLAIAFVPYIGVPLFLIFGGRKLRKLAARKARLCPIVPGVAPSPAAATATAQVLTLNGSCPPVGGNQVRFLVTGEDSFATLERHIREARHSIDVMTFILARDAVGRRLVRLLAERARHGVKVRVLLDALGCFASSGSFVDPIRRAGGRVEKFMPVMPLQSRGSANLRNHRKIAIFDHHVAMLGGRNVAKEYMGPTHLKNRWRDFGAEIRGPAVGLLQEIFLADWAFASGEPLEKLHAALPPSSPAAAGDSELQIVASGPDVDGDPLYEGILSLIETAEKSLWVITPYFIPDEVLLRMMLVKARSGVDVRLVVPARSNHPITDLARLHALRQLHAAGARVLLYQPGMNHAKAMLVDERIGLFGSANMDMRSLFVNFEVGIVTYSPREAQHLSDWMGEVFAQSKPMPSPAHERRLMPLIGEEISRLLAPLL
jgi:cardiolipin synthase A/B